MAIRIYRSRFKKNISRKNTLLMMFLFSLLLSFSNSQVGVYPDDYKTLDAVFLTEPTGTTTAFLYQGAYFTETIGSKPILYLNKEGIALNPVDTTTLCENGDGGGGAVTVSSANTDAYTNLYSSATPTTDLGEIWMNTITSGNNSGVICKFRLYSSGNASYTWTLKIPIFNNSGSNGTIKVYASSNINNFDLNALAAWPTVNANSAHDLRITIRQVTSQTSLVRVGTNPTNAMMNASGFLFLKFVIEDGGGANIDLRLSWFALTLQNTSLVYTRNGSGTCNVTTNPCLEGYMCDAGTCRKCHASCLTCNGTSNTNCVTCARHTAEWKSGPVGNSCTFEYVDISQFTTISAKGIDQPITNRVTLSFWAFVSNLTNFRASNNVVNISVKNYVLVSLYGSSNTSIGAFCTAYEKLKSGYETLTDYASLVDAVNSDTTTRALSVLPTSDQITLGGVTTLNARWFFVQCAMSFDHKKFYINTVVNNVDDYQPFDLPSERFYTNPNPVYNDFYFKTFYRTGEKLTVNIYGASGINTHFYIKNLNVFSEYMPVGLRYMHFDLEKIVSSNDYWPELLYSLNFDQFTYGANFSVRSKTYPSADAITVTLTKIGTPDLFPPINFKRLELIKTENTKWTSRDLIDNSGSISKTMGKQLLVFDDGKALTCENSNLLELTTYTCNTTCDNPTDYTVYPGVSFNKGYCNYQCNNSMLTCLDSASLVADMANQFQCTGTDVKNVYYRCLDMNYYANAYLYYNSFYTPGNIYITNPKLPAYRSYIIEIWYLRDNTMNQNNYLTSGYNNYIFYSNSMRLYIDYVTKNYKLQYGHNPAGNVDIEASVNRYEWNKFIFNVYWDTTRYNLEFYVKNTLTAAVATANTTTNQSLREILFCHLDSGNCGPNLLSIHWASGLYKGLRVWNGDMAQPYTVQQYDTIFSGYTTSRPASITNYYPLSLRYITDNTLYDPLDSGRDVTLTHSWNDFVLQAYNFSTNVDYIKGDPPLPSTPKYVSTIDITTKQVTLFNCNTACQRCWGTSITTDCYECSNNYFLVGAECKSTASGRYFFTSPSKSAVPTVIKFNAFGSNVVPKGTITFWVKIFGFSLSSGTFIDYSSLLSLTYDSTNYGTNTSYGLNLVYSGTQLVNEPAFRFHFGKWTFFSLAFYEDSDPTVANYFPPMLKFEINNTSYKILTPNISGISIGEFAIYPNLWGLVANVKVYDTYIIGAYGFETNRASPAAPGYTPIPVRTHLAPGANHAGCLNKATETQGWTDNYICTIDYGTPFDNAQICNNVNLYYNISVLTQSCTAQNNTCPTKPVVGGIGCSTMCMGNTTNANNVLTSCSCLIDNSNTSMFLRNGGANICYRFDYINFAKTSTITLNNVKTAQATEKYTLQFWIFAYNYASNTFGGVTMKWNYHNKIQIYYSGGYKFKCFPLFDSVDSSYESSISHEINYTINAWNFISCAVDRVNNIFYMNTESVSYQNTYGVSEPPLLLSSATSSLIITDDTSAYSDWGVLFFRQIRLWRDAYTSAGFLSRVDIQDTTLFSDLLDLWDPVYTGTNEMVDLAGHSATVTLTYNSVRGQNVVDDTAYSTLYLCSENGEYYDVTSQSCVQFLDLSKVSNISFPNVPVSYSGDYTMEFWIFTEDFNDLTKGVNVIWDKHLAISIIKNTDFVAYCFPQAYYDDLSNTNGADINSKFAGAINVLSQSLTSMTGIWSWIRCSVSNYNKKFYINDTIDDLKGEILYDTTRNDYPFRYYFHNNQKVTLKVQNMNLHTKKLYMRYIYLFKDYLPQDYTFKYMDLTNVGTNYFPSLVFSSNFAKYNFTTKRLKYSLYEYGFTSTIDTDLLLTVSGGSFALAANFIALPLCSPAGIQRYDSVTNSCVTHANCVNLNSWYCYEEYSPLTCNNNYYYNTGTPYPSCLGSCPADTMRTPGSVPTNGICNTPCDDNVSSCPRSSVGELSSLSSYFICKGGFSRINYRCVDTANSVPDSGILYSRCYRMPNVYRALSVTTTSKLNSGHILEVWFKMDRVYNNASFCPYSQTKEYYLYATPHSIYLDRTDNKFYYNVINSTSDKGVLEDIDLFEWNRILIKTTIISGVQSVYVYVNDELSSPAVSLTGISAVINMKITSISFCAWNNSSNSNGNCVSGSGLSAVEWGSAYYKNIRIWDVSSSTEWLVQAYNNKLFTETLKSLILYYPLTVDKVDVNTFTNTVGNYDHLVYTVNYSGTNRLYSVDSHTLINYSTVFDWGAQSANSGKFIDNMTGTTIISGTCATECKRCYSPANTDCYECVDGYVLEGRTCTAVTGYYFKIPVTSNSPVSLKITDGTNYNLATATSFTMTFWVKFFGVTSTATSSVPYLVSLSSNTYFGYNTSTKYLVFSQNSQTAFIDTTWNSNAGSWVLITFSNYRSNTNNSVYPNMVTMSVDNVDIPMQSTYTIPSSGISITQVQLGYEVVALFAEFRFYTKFYQGVYGHVTSSTTTRANQLMFMISLWTTTPVNCITNANLASGDVATMNPKCIGDYNPYLDDTYQCQDDTKYMDLSIYSVTPPCDVCNSLCPTLCFKDTAADCTCDLSLGYFWLRKNSITSKTYCQPIPNIDFSSYKTVTLNNVSSSDTLESTIEFWAFIYSYNTASNRFRQVDIEWNLHNKVSLFNQSNSLNSRCSVLTDLTNASRYSENISLTLTYYKWNLIRCGTDLRNKKFFYNSVIKDMQTTDIPTRPAISTLKISMPTTAIENFGFIFLRDMKLWRQFNYQYIDTSYIQLDYSRYPGLLHYFKNTYDSTVVTMQDLVQTTVNVALERRTNFIGYNYVDSQNVGIYVDLTLCDEGKAYNPTTKACVTPPVSDNCEYVADLNDNCITCPAEKKYIDPQNGDCVSTCPPKWFPNDKMNQCRKCDSTCYQCTDIYYDNCTACTGSLYLVADINQCVPNCEAYQLTKSLTTPNICVIFDASAILINVSELVLIDNTTFDTLTAQVIGATSPDYTTNWRFDSAKTLTLNNNDPKLVLNPSGPFTSATTSLTVSLDPDFFQLGFKYNFALDIIRTNEDSSVIVTKDWTLTMNQAPLSGRVKVTPPMGLRNTTTFILNCPDWVDDNTSDLDYKFYSVEKNTNTVNEIMDWSKVNEAYTNFTVRYFQLRSSDIDVFCEVRDQFGATSVSSTTITIVNSLSSRIYNLTIALKGYTLPALPSEDEILTRSEYLKSLGIDPYKEVAPEFLISKYSPSLDNSIVTIEDPKCSADFCNKNGICDLVDVSLSCYCELGYLGSNCHIDSNGYKTLESEYFNLYNAINMNIGSTLSDKQLDSMWNLFFSAKSFIQDPTFFSSSMSTFVTLATNSFMDKVVAESRKFLDLYDFYYEYHVMRLNQNLIRNKNVTSYPYRNVTLAVSQQQEFSVRFADVRKGLNDLITKIIKKLGTTAKTIKYDTKNMYIAITQLTPVFKEADFFKDRISDYKSWVEFMNCINYIHINKLNNPYYVAWLAFVEYQIFPFNYDNNIYANNTAPLVEVFFIDAQTGKSIIVEGCEAPNAINFYLPFTSYTWMEDLNAQKWLYDPNNYKAPDDPIFSSPIYINETGFVSNDTVEDRINLYHRKYNFTCKYYDDAESVFSEKGINYTNFTNNFIAFSTDHLTPFSSFFEQNDVEYVVDGRFFYLKHPQIFLYAPNYWTNYAWFAIFSLLCFYSLALLILTCYDYRYFRQESLLNFLKKEILRVHSPYQQKVNMENMNDLVPEDYESHHGHHMGEIYPVSRGGNYNPERKDDYNFNNSDENSPGEHKDPHGSGDVLKLNDNKNMQTDRDVKIAFDDDEFNFADIADTGNRNLNGKDEDKYKDDFNMGVGDNMNKNNDVNKKKGFFDDETVEYGGVKNKPDDLDNNFGDNPLNDNAINDNKPSKKEKNIDNDDFFGNNNYINPMDRRVPKFKFNDYIGNVLAEENNKAAAADPLADDNEDEEEEYQKRLEAFGNLNLGACQFMCWNIRQRHVLLAPLINVSVFNPRYKKLTFFITECALIMLLLAVQMTNATEVKVDFSTTPATLNNLSQLIGYAFVSVLGSCFAMYILAFFFRVSSRERKRLYKLVVSGEQLMVLKEWEEMLCTNMFNTIIGMTLNIAFWGGAFYISVGFCAVWKEYAMTWLVGFGIAFIVDFFLFEFLFEWFISILYYKRTSSQCCLKLSEWLNRVRAYRTLWP